MGQWPVYINSFRCNLQLLFPFHVIKGSHIVKPVSQLDENYSWIICQG
jgi:hypothetical protein